MSWQKKRKFWHDDNGEGRPCHSQSAPRSSRYRDREQAPRDYRYHHPADPVTHLGTHRRYRSDTPSPSSLGDASRVTLPHDQRRHEARRDYNNTKLSTLNTSGTPGNRNVQDDDVGGGEERPVNGDTGHRHRPTRIGIPVDSTHMDIFGSAVLQPHANLNTVKHKVFPVVVPTNTVSEVELLVETQSVKEEDGEHACEKRITELAQKASTNDSTSSDDETSDDQSTEGKTIDVTSENENTSDDSTDGSSNADNTDLDTHNGNHVTLTRNVKPAIMGQDPIEMARKREKAQMDNAVKRVIKIMTESSNGKSPKKDPVSTLSPGDISRLQSLQSVIPIYIQECAQHVLDAESKKTDSKKPGSDGSGSPQKGGRDKKSACGEADGNDKARDNRVPSTTAELDDPYRLAITLISARLLIGQLASAQLLSDDGSDDGVCNSSDPRLRGSGGAASRPLLNSASSSLLATKTAAAIASSGGKAFPQANVSLNAEILRIIKEREDTISQLQIALTWMKRG